MEGASLKAALARASLLSVVVLASISLAGGVWAWRTLSAVSSAATQNQVATLFYGAIAVLSGVALFVLLSLSHWRRLWSAFLRDIAANSEAYQKRERFLKEVQALAKVGSWEYDHEKKELRWSDEVFALAERDAAEGASPELFDAILHPEDREAVYANIEAVFQSGEPYEHEYRILTPSGGIKRLREIGRPVLNDAGVVVGAYGAAQDVTALREAEEVLRKANEELEESVAESSEALSLANETLRERDAFLSLIIEQTPLYLYWKDRNSVYLGCTANYAKIHYRASPEDIIGKTDFDLLPSRERAEFYHALDRQVMEANEPILHQLQKIEHEGAVIRWIDSCKAPMKNARGEVIGVLGYFEDVTERMEALHALGQREEALRAVIDNAPVVLFSVDTDERFTFVDGAALRALNITAAEALGASITDFFEDQDAFPLALRRALGGESHSCLIQGEGLYFQMRLAPMHGDAGEIQGVIGVAVDVTERTLAEQYAKEQQSLVRNVLDTAPNIIFVKDKQGRITLANQAAADLFGVEIEEMVGKTEEDLPLLAGEGAEAGGAALLQERFIPEMRVATPSAGVKWLYIMRRPLFNAEGEPSHLLVIATDISQRKSVEEDLIRAKEAAEVANQAKSQLIASMSHELRTPLNAILGFSEMLAEESVGELNAKQKRFSENILTSGKQLLRLINDVLELAKLDARRLDMEFAVFSPAEALQDVFMLAKHAALVKKARIEMRIAPELTDILADKARFKQIAYTLIDNAVKFSPEGAVVEVVAEIRGTNTANDNLYLEISDEGAGIQPEDLERIFYETEPLGSSERHKYTGIRIGLALVRRLVEAHEGRIWAQNREDGAGSRFCLELPIRANNSVLPPLNRS